MLFGWLTKEKKDEEEARYLYIRKEKNKEKKCSGNVEYSANMCVVER